MNRFIGFTNATLEAEDKGLVVTGFFTKSIGRKTRVAFKVGRRHGKMYEVIDYGAKWHVPTAFGSVMFSGSPPECVKFITNSLF